VSSIHPSIRVLLRLIALAAGIVASAAAAAGDGAGQASSLAAVERYLAAQAAGAPGVVRVHVEPATNPLPPCSQLEPFLPTGVAAWGRLSVGVRCAGEHPWTRFLSARVRVDGAYLAAARALCPGEEVQSHDVEQRTGDLTALPRSILTDPVQLRAMRVVNPIPAGAPLRSELLRGEVVVHRGQLVRLTAEGTGFVASTDGQALADGAAGTQVKAKTVQGRVLSGTARQDGSVSVGK
jgi:flagellar basal body P-ring formation protein FlgA